MSEDLKKLAEKKHDDFVGLYGRMDKDSKTYLLDPYTLKDFADDKPIPRVVSITLNDPGTFAHRVIAIMQSSDPQVVVESDSFKKTEENPIEEFIPALEYEADSYLANRVRGMSFPFYCEQACVRGWVAGLNLLRVRNNKLVPDLRPLDSRFVSYEPGMDGLEWGAYWGTRSRIKIFQEYKYDIAPNDNEEVFAAYSKTHHQVWIGEEKIKDVEHPYKRDGKGYVPMVIQPMPTGSMLQADDMMVNWGESIFSLNRALYPKLNEMASVLENLTMASFFAAKQYESEKGESAEQPEFSPTGLGVIVSVEKGGGYKLIPVADIRNATRLLYAMLEGRIQRGSLPNIDFGNLTFPLSAVAISRLTESKDMIFVPRLQGLAQFYQQRDRMVLDQYIEIGKNLRMGEEGYRKIFPVASLKGEYTIKRRYFPKDPEQDIANIAQANQIREGLMSEHTIRRTVLKLKDPDGEEDLLRAEKAEKINPVIALRKQVHSLINREEYLEAELTLQSIEDLLKQRAMGQAISQIPEAKREQPKSLMPLLEQGGGGGQRRTEQENVEEEMGGEEERIGRRAETGREGRPTEA